MLENPEISIRYAAAYYAYIQDIWKNSYPEISGRTVIVATVYNLGHEKTSPNTNPKPNNFGTFARDNYILCTQINGNIKGGCIVKKKRIIIILIIIISFFVLFWLGSFIKCEILTARHGQEFSELYKLTNMIDKIDYLKVMEYSEDNARVYYVTENLFGNMISFVKYNNNWDMVNWETIWSKSGSADGFIWPYIR